MAEAELVPSERVLSAADITVALRKAEERFGDARWAEEILEAWAKSGQVTPAGQRLLPEVVASILSGRPKRSAPCSQGQELPATPVGKRLQETATTAKRAKAADPVEQAPEPVPEPLVAPKDGDIPELVKRRLEEVLKEIGTHMEEILDRLGLLQRWREVPEGSDRREAYCRLLHSTQEPEVSAPAGLEADLLPHQLEGLEWLVSLYVNNLHGILADEMGLGKTIQTITLLLFLQEQKGNVGPHLIVAPKSTLSNWKTEFGRFAPSYAVRVLTSDQEAKEAELQALQGDIAQKRATACITNYEQVHRHKWLLETEWQVIVVDEGHRLKNPETVLHNAMARMKCRMRLLLTGTPLQNRIGELWALLHYLLPDLFTCMMDFKAWFAQPFKGIPGFNEFDVQLDREQETQVVAEMHTLLAPFLLQRLKSEVLGDKLPPRVETTIRVPLSAWQRAAYRDLEKKTKSLAGDDGVLTSEQVSNALMQLRKVSLHPFLFQESFSQNEDLYRTSGKLEALDRILPKLLAFQHKVLVFSQFTTLLDILESYMEWRGHACVRLDGQVSHEKRAERIRRFSTEPELKVFLLSARAGGLGLNLQAADSVVLFDLDWNPQNDKQAVARVHRVGQTKEVRVLRLLTESAVERHMEQCCKEKLELEKKIMGAGMFQRQATQGQRHEALKAVLGLSGEGEGEGNASPDLGECTSFEELNRALARSTEELEAFQAMDRALLGEGTEALDGKSVEERLVNEGRLMRSVAWRPGA